MGREPLSSERRRLLAARSELGYVEEASRALRGEPEAVSAEHQRRLTEDARARGAGRRLERWRQCSAAVRGLLSEAGLGPGYASDLRVIARQLDRIEGRLARGG